jgi:hypothetical protein
MTHDPTRAPLWFVGIVAIALVLAVGLMGQRLTSVEQHNACVVEYLADPPGLYRGHKCLSP